MLLLALGAALLLAGGGRCLARRLLLLLFLLPRRARRALPVSTAARGRGGGFGPFWGSPGAGLRRRSPPRRPKWRRAFEPACAAGCRLTGPGLRRRARGSCRQPKRRRPSGRPGRWRAEHGHCEGR